MAKAKDVENLITGIIGEPKRDLHAMDEKGELPKDTIEELGIPADLADQLNEIRKRKVGRPKKHESGKGREPRATFIVDQDTLRKIKYISLADTRLIKDVIQEAFLSYVTAWEKENGVINLPNTKTK